MSACSMQLLTFNGTFGIRRLFDILESVPVISGRAHDSARAIHFITEPCSSSTVLVVVMFSIGSS
jgi:hypothetical protein